MQILIDHNIEGLAPLLPGVLAKEGRVELLQLQFLYFSETTLPVDSDDTAVWALRPKRRGAFAYQQPQPSE